MTDADAYEISDDPARLDRDAIHAFLSQSYWSPGLPRDVLNRAIDGSLCFGVYGEGAQVGFARVITDRATFAYLADVYVLEAHRGRGVATRLMRVIMGHPALQGLRRFMLVTRDAHAVYRPFGFTDLAFPERVLELVNRNVYQTSQERAAG